ncbi:MULTISPECIES: putative bifunctional diguanylate cyclase/phosphodiesterase [Thiorhodovibrio]|uniref:putative bifunctional diguanylate cyclase/phosphodiesterase n=1 Tax=Thiorhodovibrio TaxID=61593 RepID=UPI001911CEDE|nr:GGDEF domain-containing phosphodiesterase [Thiorhodovibrio litoralis]MBK5969819.1 GGDEF domain-containing protein [Thiorhodovibrio winogradskyi]
MTEKHVIDLSHALMIAERRRQETQRLSGVGFWELDHQAGLLYWSEEIYAIYELSGNASEPNYDLFLRLIHDEDRELVDTTYRSSVESGEEYNIRYRIKAGSSVKWIEARGVTHYDDQGVPDRSIGTAQDITEIITAQQQVEHLAYHDALTDLPNRKLFSDRMNTAVRLAEQDATNLAVLFIDLDNFKLINDRYGHDVGDEVLVGVAHQLRSCSRTGDTFARIGGDEFAGVLIGVGDAEVDVAIEKVKQTIDGTYQTRTRSFDVTASIGVTMYPRDSAEPDILLRHADQAMYEAKERGKSRVRYFDTDRYRSNWSRHQLQRDIEIALTDDQFALYFQPRVSLIDGTLAGAEALLRWFTPTGPVSPLDVIAAISGTPLEWQLDRWVTETLLKHHETFRAHGIDGPFSLNINPSTIEDRDFPELLESLLKSSGVRGQDLEIEILEISSITNFERTNEILCRCKAFGISFSLDDFGTGYSSLTHFHFLPIGKLKIDQSFIKHLNSDADSLALVRSILALAHANNRQVVAEGVETDAIAQTLAGLGCEYGQGYGLARPMPVSDYISWTQAWDADAFMGRVKTPH